MRTAVSSGWVAAAAALAWSAHRARRREVTDGEASVFRAVNGLPDVFEGSAWVAAQPGALGAAFVAAGVARAVGDRRCSRRLLASGVGAWGLVKLIKPLVGRGRPAQVLDDVVVRGRPQRGLGYPSGHAAVSTALALVGARCGRGRVLGLVVAAIVGCSRMYSGAHLPMDIGGGFAVGAVAAMVTERFDSGTA
jgi:membrane-associated phospholipid phosphatase